MLRRLFCIGMLGLIVAPQAARSQDFDSYSCQQLWWERNAIYKDRGYCFRTDRAIRAFGNAGCQYDDVESVPLSNTERRIIADVQAWERRKRCPR